MMLRARLRRHDGIHLGRREVAVQNRLLIEGVHAIDKITIPFTIDIEIAAKHTIDEDIDHVPEGDEQMEVEAAEKQRQNILRANSLEAFGRTIVVDILLFVPVKRTVPAILN